MTLLDMVVYHKERHSLQSVKEICVAHPYGNIPFDILKSSVSVFVNELLYTAIREEEPHHALFDFIWNSMAALDDNDGPVALFPLLFMTRLMHYLGCFPQCNHSPQTPFFDLREGCFQATVPVHPQYLHKEESEWLFRLLSLAKDESGPVLPRSCEGEVPLNAIQRSRLLGILMTYYHLHLPWFRELQSHHVLHSVLS
jgi:DNA repair protein RecO (recombination protein O)